MVKDRGKIGFALGGGGARGLAHIGVLKVFEERGIFPDIIVGTSIGALVGALYAGGYKPGEIERLMLGLDWKKLVYLVDFTLPFKGLLRGKRVVSLLRSVIGDLTFPKLKYAFACVATDIINGEQVVLHEGSLIDSVQASISIPGIFTPVVISGRYLVDGGLVNTVPVSVCREMGVGYVIGVNVIPEPGKGMCNPNKDQHYPVCRLPKLEETGGETNSTMLPRIVNPSLWSRIDDTKNAFKMFCLSGHLQKEIGVLKSPAISEVKKVYRSRTKSPSLVEVLSQTLTIAEYRVAMENLKDADLAISPDVDEIGFWQFNNAAYAIAAGEYAARIALEGKNTFGLLGKI